MLHAGFHSLPRSHCPDVARHTHDGWRHRNVTMTETEILAERFEANRSHLRSVAYRMLGSQTEADDAVQESFLRVMRAGTSGVDNFAGWLTTIVARVCLDMLRGRGAKSRSMPKWKLSPRPTIWSARS